MGDMGDLFRAWNERKKRVKENKLAVAKEGRDLLKTKCYAFKVNTEYHWTIWLSDTHRVEYWPSSGKWREPKRSDTLHGTFEDFLNRLDNLKKKYVKLSEPPKNDLDYMDSKSGQIKTYEPQEYPEDYVPWK